MNKATEMYEKAILKSHEQHQKVYDEIIANIEREAANGYFTWYYGKPIDAQVMTWLIADGFDVKEETEECDYYHPYLYKISWEEKKDA